MWRDTIDLMVELGIAERRDGELALRDDALGDLAAEETSMFRRTLRGIILAPEHNTGLWDHAKGEPWPSTAAREFSRMPPGYRKARSANNLVMQRRPSVEPVAPSKARRNSWRTQSNGESFVRWADALGLTSRVGAFQLPDPTVAVEEELAGVFRSKGDFRHSRCERVSWARYRFSAMARIRGGLDRFLTDKPRRLPPKPAPPWPSR